MDEQDVPRLRMRNPGEVTQLVPYLVGFTPEESLVILVTRNSRVEVTARVDLADIQPPGAAEALLDRIWARFPDANAYLLAYTADHQAGWDMLHRCDAHLPSMVLRRSMMVDADTWELPDGEAGTIDRFGMAASEATHYGLQHRESRANLEASFASAPDSDHLTTTVADVLDTLPRPRETTAIIDLTQNLLRRNLPTPESNPAPPTGATHRVPVEEAIKLAILAQNPSGQNVALLSMTRDNAPQHLQLWRDIVNQVPEYGAEGPLYLAGMAAWISGDGASAAIALDRSLAVSDQPELSYQTSLLSQLIDQVIPPSAWDSIRPQVLAQADPRVRAAVTTSPASDRDLWETVAPPRLTRRPERPDTSPPNPGIAI